MLILISLKHQELSSPTQAGKGSHGCECLGNRGHPSPSCASFSWVQN